MIFFRVSTDLREHLFTLQEHYIEEEKKTTVLIRDIILTIMAFYSQDKSICLGI